MTTKMRARYEISQKEKMIRIYDYEKNNKTNGCVTDYSECAFWDSFESESDPTEGEENDNLPLEIEDDESEDADFIFDSSSN